MVTRSLEFGQVPFEVVQRKTFGPKLNPLTAELFRAGFVIVPVPETSDQLPVPIAGLFPASVAVAEQTF